MSKYIKKIWENEYSKKKLMRGDKPQNSVLNFLKFYKKRKKKERVENPFENINVLDLGSGQGKNSIHIGNLGANVWGMELASNAVLDARSKLDINLKDRVKFVNSSFGKRLDFVDIFFDIVIDITSSNSLREEQRDIYLKEVYRVLKEEGYFIVRGLLKDGDKNAKYMLKEFPGIQYDTYVIPKFGLEERVFSETDFKKMYGKYFSIEKFIKESHYTTYGDKKYKRNFFVAYLKKN